MAKKKIVPKKENPLKKKLAEKRKAAGVTGKRRGRPASKKPVVGFEISSKDQNKLGSDFANLQKTFDSVGEQVSKLAFEAAPKSAMSAIKEIITLQKGMKTFCKTVRTVKKNLKPKYGEVPA
jgi:hypothetical protein